jgi:hypothetical protein
MTTYSVTLTHTENSALGYASLTQQAWIENVIRERCRIAIDEIVTIAVQKCLETNTQIPGSKDDIVKLAFDMGWVLSGEERNNQLASLVV